MNFYNLILDIIEKEINVDIFVDMDGVIAAYRPGERLNFKTKRPLTSNIKTLENISKIKGVNLFILSICRENYQRDDKNAWLDKNAPFFKKENRIIISREANDMLESASLKANYLKELKREDSIIIVIDDDPKNLKEIRKLNDDVELLKDTVLID